MGILANQLIYLLLHTHFSKSKSIEIGSFQIIAPRLVVTFDMEP